MEILILAILAVVLMVIMFIGLAMSLSDNKLTSHLIFILSVTGIVVILLMAGLLQ